MSMKPNFYSPLQIDNDGERVNAAGPLNWNGTQGDCKVSVTIKQTVNGEDVWAWGQSQNYDTHAADWGADTDTRGDQRLQPGPAHAWGVVTLTNSTDPPPLPWDQPVQLT